MARVPIDTDLPCIACGYNLRGLTTSDNCPECGRPAIETVDAGADAQESDQVELAQRARALEVAEASGYGVDAVLFVSAALNYTLSHVRREEQEHVTAKDVCAGFREYVRMYFNDAAEAVDLLSEWGLRGSDDVGRIVFAMVETGQAKSADGDRPEDFAGVFTLDDLARDTFWTPNALGGDVPPGYPPRP
jgi:uncharacterized repeat protein (TIGR04138 family)